ncbi:MAG: ACT domain-containing protein [Acidimicrobiia bacterium]
MTEFIIRLANRPGMLASLTETLAEVGVNIEALAAFGLNEEGVVRLIVDDADTARRAFREAGLVCEERQVLTTYLPHRPGELAAIARRLAEAGVNIDALYVLKTNSHGIELAIAVNEPDTARTHLPTR